MQSRLFPLALGACQTPRLGTTRPLPHVSCMSRLATFLFASMFALGASAQEPPTFPACIGVRASAPYTGAGYDHIVSLANSCEVSAECRVMTDVSPRSIDVS